MASPLGGPAGRAPPRGQHSQAPDAADDYALQGAFGSRAHLFEKTRLCSFFERGRCRRGQSCTFAHGEAELRPEPKHIDAETLLCIDFFRTGTCSQGDACPYSHGGVWERDPRKRVLCIDFFRAGGCPRGVFCKYAHSAEGIARRMTQEPYRTVPETPPPEPMMMARDRMAREAQQAMRRDLAAAAPPVPPPPLEPRPATRREGTAQERTTLRDGPAPMTGAAAAQQLEQRMRRARGADREAQLERRRREADREAQLERMRREKEELGARIAELQSELARMQSLSTTAGPGLDGPEVEDFDEDEDGDFDYSLHDDHLATPEAEPQGAHSTDWGPSAAAPGSFAGRQTSEDADLSDAFAQPSVALAHPPAAKSSGAWDAVAAAEEQQAAVACELVVRNTFLVLAPCDMRPGAGDHRAHSAPPCAIADSDTE